MWEAVETDTSSLVSGGGSRVIGLVAAVVTPTTLITALAGDLSSRLDPGAIAAVAGLCALILGIALLAGQPLASSYGYLRALGPAAGVSLLLYASRASARSAAKHYPRTVFVGVGVVLVSLFWATSEYAASRGRSEAKRLARDLLANPSVTVFSKEPLNINPLGPGGGVLQGASHGGGCPEILVAKLRGGEYTRSYSGFTLLIRSGNKYFLTPTPIDKNTAWEADRDSVFIIPDDNDVRIELTRGVDYAPSVESTAKGQLAFTC
jgi:hypothetical protein